MRLIRSALKAGQPRSKGYRLQTCSWWRWPALSTVLRRMDHGVIFAAFVGPHDRQDIETVFDGVQMRLLAGVDGGNRDLGDAQALHPRQYDHLQGEVEGLRELYPRDLLDRLARVQHVAAVVLGELHAEGPVLDGRQHLVRNELIERHVPAAGASA